MSAEAFTIWPPTVVTLPIRPRRTIPAAEAWATIETFVTTCGEALGGRCGPSSCCGDCASAATRRSARHPVSPPLAAAGQVVMTRCRRATALPTALPYFDQNTLAIAHIQALGLDHAVEQTLRHRKTAVPIVRHGGDQRSLPFDALIAVGYMPLDVGEQFQVLAEFVLFDDQNLLPARTHLR